MPFEFVGLERARKLRKSCAQGGWHRPLRKATVARADALARRYEAAVARAFKAGMRAILTRSVCLRLARAIKAHNGAEALRVLPPAHPHDPRGFTPLAVALRAALMPLLAHATQAELDRLRRTRKAEDSGANPYAVKWIDQATIRGLVRQSFTEGLTVDQLADMLEPVLSLSERDANAVARRLEDRLDEGLVYNDAKGMAQDYADDLLASRAETIARTETIQALNQGQMAAWDEAIQQGLLPGDIQRQWIGSPEGGDPNSPCPICVELDGQTAGMNDSFDSTYLDDVFCPPAHPRCRCTLVIADDNADDRSFRDSSRDDNDDT